MIKKERKVCDVCNSHVLKCSIHTCQICNIEVCTSCGVSPDGEYGIIWYCPKCFALGEPFLKEYEEEYAHGCAVRADILKRWKERVKNIGDGVS